MFSIPRVLRDLTPLVLLALAGNASAQSQAFLSQTHYVTNDGAVQNITATTPFVVTHGGHLRATVTFATPHYDSTSGQFITPNLATLWSVRNSDFAPLGSSEWHGDDENQSVLPLLSFDPGTGVGQAQIDVPVAQDVGSSAYPSLPNGGAFVLFVFGEQGVLSRDAAGIPINFDNYAILTFDTDYPEILTLVDNQSPGIGDRVQVTILMAEPAPMDMSLDIEMLGSATFQHDDGGPINSWTVTIPAGTVVYALDTVAKSEGAAFARVTRSDGVSSDGPWCQVDPHDTEVQYEITGFTDSGEGSSDDDTTVQQNKRCVPGSCSPNGGDRSMDCTRPFVELVEPPINPNCKTGNVGIVRDGGCRQGGEECVDREVTMACPKYVYAGTEDRDAGSIEVGLKITVEGEMNWLIVKAKTTGEFHTTVMSPVTRRCCKYTPVAGETVNVKVKSCN